MKLNKSKSIVDGWLQIIKETTIVIQNNPPAAERHPVRCWWKSLRSKTTCCRDGKYVTLWRVPSFRHSSIPSSSVQFVGSAEKAKRKTKSRWRRRGKMQHHWIEDHRTNARRKYTEQLCARKHLSCIFQQCQTLCICRPFCCYCTPQYALSAKSNWAPVQCVISSSSSLSSPHPPHGRPPWGPPRNSTSLIF